jgi:hypothetical protein
MYKRKKIGTRGCSFASHFVSLGAGIRDPNSKPSKFKESIRLTSHGAAHNKNWGFLFIFHKIDMS